MSQCKPPPSFQFSIFSLLSSSTPNTNILFSPISLYHSLSLLSNGARGPTQHELITSIHHIDLIGVNAYNLNLLSSLKPSLHLASALLSKYPPSPSFLNIVHKYDSFIGDLSSLALINTWCQSRTNNQITNITNDITDIDLLLLSAVYFKGEWFHKFKAKDTYTSIFNNADNTHASVHMMKQVNNYNYYEDDDVQVIEMDYQEDDVSALIVLPKEEIDDYVKEKLREDVVRRYLREMKYCDVEVHVPRFEMEWKGEVSGQLKEIGIRSAFDAEKADFGNLSTHGGLVVKEVVQKNVVKVNEEGTEAASVTAVGMTRAMNVMFKAKNVMIVDKPFLVLIRNCKVDKGFLFIGKVVKLEDVKEEK